MIRILKKQFSRQNAVGNMLVRKFSFAPIEVKIQLFKSNCYPIYGCALWHHSFQNSIRKLTVSYSDTFMCLINVHRYTSSSLAFAMNATDHINVVLRKFAYSLMSRVVVSPNSIVTAIVNSDAYHQSPLMDKWESMFIRIGVIIDRIIPLYVNVWHYPNSLEYFKYFSGCTVSISNGSLNLIWFILAHVILYFCNSCPSMPSLAK